MSTFPKLQRNISYKIYIIDLLLAFLIVLLNSSFIFIPLFIGLVITLDLRKSFVLPFLFFTEVMHNFLFFSLIGFYFIYKTYIYEILRIKFIKIYADAISIFLIYILYFLWFISFNILNEKVISFDVKYKTLSQILMSSYQPNQNTIVSFDSPSSRACRD
jgi:hypothetical protein